MGAVFMSFQETFKALSDRTRRDILEKLKDGRLTAGEIAADYDMSAATVSHHLAVLKNCGLISDERVGKNIYYELELSVIDEILSWIAGFRGENNEKN
jgi:DNA-binding transcriptional ArsR family regulator